MQIFSERKVLARAAGQQVAALDITVFQDPAQQLPASLQLALDLRLFGADVTNDWKKPLQNGDIKVDLRPSSAGSIAGTIDDVQGIDHNGKPVAWDQAVAVSFTLTGKAEPTLDILALVPGLPILLRPIVALLGGRVKVSLGSTKVVAPLHHK